MKKPQVIYIMSRGHSGSTMLELLLNRGRNISAMGEIDMLGLQTYRSESTRWIGKCSCGSRPFECPVWGEVLSGLYRHYSADLRTDPFSWPVSDIGLEEEFGSKKPAYVLRYRFHRLLRTLIQHYNLYSQPISNTYRNWAANRDVIYTLYASSQNVEAVVDASKDPIQAIDLINFSNVPSKIIFLTRDVRGLTWSALKHKRANTAKQEAIRWTKQNQRMIDKLKSISKDLWIHVKYEDLCENLENELNRIYCFLGIERMDLTPDMEKKLRHTIAGNKTRFHDLKIIKEDNRWRENLTDKDLSDIKRVSHSVASELGYEF